MHRNSGIRSGDKYVYDDESDITTSILHCGGTDLDSNDLNGERTDVRNRLVRADSGSVEGIDGSMVITRLYSVVYCVRVRIVYIGFCDYLQ
jgi:hypothetical protein